MTVPKNKDYDPAVHLNMRDIVVDDARSPTVVQINIKHSKTDPFHRGVNLFVGGIGSDLCLVAVLLGYLCVQGTQCSPLFLFEDRQFLTRVCFVEAVWSVLLSTGVDHQKHCRHSFRISMAMTATSRGVEDSVIKTLGRWESVAYLQYIHIPQEQLSGVSCQLAVLYPGLSYNY